MRVSGQQISNRFRGMRPRQRLEQANVSVARLRHPRFLTPARRARRPCQARRRGLHSDSTTPKLRFEQVVKVECDNRIDSVPSIAAKQLMSNSPCLKSKKRLALKMF